MVLSRVLLFRLSRHLSLPAGVVGAVGPRGCALRSLGVGAGGVRSASWRPTEVDKDGFYPPRKDDQEERYDVGWGASRVLSLILFFAVFFTFLPTFYVRWHVRKNSSDQPDP